MTRLRTRYYQQFDADPSHKVPAETYGAWKQAEIDIDLQGTALVVMHAWNPGSAQTHPAWWRTVEYLPRAADILAEVFPPLLQTVRKAEMNIFHVVGGPNDYYSHLLEEPSSIANDGALPTIAHPELDRLKQWRARHVFVGEHNQAEVDAALNNLDFAPQARPHPGEGIATNASDLDLLCRKNNIHHLLYIGFAINWCLLMSPGGMTDMSRLGYLCSTIPEAVTAVENKETAHLQLEKEQALWRVSLAFGFVFELKEILSALMSKPSPQPLPGA